MYVPAVFPFDHDMEPATPDVPVSGLLHGLALAENYAVAPVAMDFDYAVTQNRLAVLDRQTLAVTFITVGLGPRAVETYSVTTVQAAPALALAVTAAPTTFTSAGAVISYSYQLTNSGNVTLAGPFTVTDDKAAVTCPPRRRSLRRTVDDLHGLLHDHPGRFRRGSVTNTATGHGSCNGEPRGLQHRRRDGDGDGGAGPGAVAGQDRGADDLPVGRHRDRLQLSAHQHGQRRARRALHGDRRQGRR